MPGGSETRPYRDREADVGAALRAALLDPPPGANGQGVSKEEARASLAEAIALVLEDRREDALRGVPPEAERDTVIVE